MRKNGLGGDSKSQSSLIDRIEGRCYVWGKLNNYDTLIYSEGQGMWGNFSLVGYESLVMQDKQRQG